MQLMSNVIDFAMAPQAAIEAPRWLLPGPGGDGLLMELGFQEGSVQQMAARGRNADCASAVVQRCGPRPDDHARCQFGRPARRSRSPRRWGCRRLLTSRPACGPTVLPVAENLIFSSAPDEHAPKALPTASPR